MLYPCCLDGARGWIYPNGNQRMENKKNNRLILLCDLGVGGERGRVFSKNGIMPSVTATEWKDPMKVIKKWKESVSDKRQNGKII